MTRRTPPRIRVFGGVAAFAPDGEVELGGPKQRAVLASLAVEPGRVVSVDRIIDVVWANQVPPRAEVSIRGYVSNLRKALAGVVDDPATALQFRDQGYLLDVPADSIDLHRFAAACRDGLAAARIGDGTFAETVLRDGLELWIGQPFGALADRPLLAEVATRFEQVRGDAVEALVDLRLELGAHGETTAMLVSEIARYPYRERLRAQLALAHYRSGDPVQALRTLDEARRVLGEEIGVDPGPEIVDLESAILAHDPMLAGRPAPRVRTAAAASTGGEPFVGRRREIDALRSAISDLLRGRGRVITISGEAGIGKSTVARVAGAEATAAGVPTGWGRCAESASAVPYRSWRSAIGEVGRAAGHAVDGLDPDEYRSADDDPTAARLHTHLSIVDRLATLPSPVMLVIDDLQWADDATLALLEFVAAELDSAPLLVVVTVRRTDTADLPRSVTDCLAELARSAGAISLVPERLDAAAVAEWVDAITGAAPVPELTAMLCRTTDGNPFYLRELLSLLDAEGRLATPSTAPLPIPLAVHDVVRRRMARLPPATQTLLTVASVIGRRFDVDLLAAVSGRPEHDAIADLAPAVDASLVEADMPTPGRFRFSHALVVEALSAEQNEGQRAGRHAQITAELERLRVGRLDTVIEELAHHAWAGAAAGTGPKGIRYSLAAAGAALAGQSSGDAADHLARALHLITATPDHATSERIDLMVTLGRTRRDSGEIVEGRAVLIDAALLAETMGDSDATAAALAALNADDLWASLDWSLYEERLVALLERMLEPSISRPAAVTAQLSSALAAELIYLDPVRAHRLSADAVAAAEQTSDPVLLARTLLQRSWGVTGSAHLDDRALLGDRFITLANEGNLPDRFVPLAHLSRVSAAYEMGDIDTVLACRAAARSSAHPARTPSGWAHLLYLDTSLAMLAGDLDRADRLTVELEGAVARVRKFAAAATRAGLRSVIETERGRTDDALAQIDVLTATPFATATSWLRAWVLASGGRHDEAAGALAAFDGHLADDWLRVALRVAGVLAAATIGDTTFLRRHLPELDPVAGRFACVGNGGLVLGPVSYAIAAGAESLGERESARVSGHAALALSEHMGAPLWSARARALIERTSTPKPSRGR